MKNFLAALTVICIVFGFAGTSFATILPQQASLKAEAFAQLIDQRQFEIAYQSSSPLMQLIFDQQDWIIQTQRLQQLLGPVQQRTLKAVRVVSTFPQLPDGDYLVVQYEARTELKNHAAEIILLKKQEAGWEVCSYSIR